MKQFILIIVAMFFLSGCWLMPYKNDFSCNADIGAGKCGMIRDNYESKDNNTKFNYLFEKNKIDGEGNE